MVDVNGQVDAALPRHLRRRSRDRSKPPAVELHRVLADLQHGRTAGPLGSRGDRLGMLERDDVEGRQPDPVRRCPSDQLGSGGQSHVDGSSLSWWAVRPGVVTRPGSWHRSACRRCVAWSRWPARRERPAPRAPGSVVVAHLSFSEGVSLGRHHGGTVGPPAGDHEPAARSGCAVEAVAQRPGLLGHRARRGAPHLARVGSRSNGDLRTIGNVQHGGVVRRGEGGGVEVVQTLTVNPECGLHPPEDETALGGAEETPAVPDGVPPDVAHPRP